MKPSKFYDLYQKYNIPRISQTKIILNLMMIENKSCLQWGEHCVECAAPDCYKARDLFSRNEKDECRRFLYGIKESKEFAYLKKYSFKIVFLP